MGDNTLATYHLESKSQIIGEDNSSITNVFPPINHEGLHISSSHSQRGNISDIFLHSSPETQPTSSPSVLPNSRPNVSRWWFELMHRNVTYIESRIRKFWVTYGGGIISFLLSPPTGLATAMLLAFWCLRIQKRQRTLRIIEESSDRLIRIVREKDEEIKKLLRQIAQMNKLISAAGISSIGATAT